MENKEYFDLFTNKLKKQVVNIKTIKAFKTYFDNDFTTFIENNIHIDDKNKLVNLNGLNMLFKDYILFEYNQYLKKVTGFNGVNFYNKVLIYINCLNF